MHLPLRASRPRFGRARIPLILAVVCLAVPGCGNGTGQGSPGVGVTFLTATSGPQGLNARTAESGAPTATCAVSPTWRELPVRRQAAQLLVVEVRSWPDAAAAVGHHGVGGVLLWPGALTEPDSGERARDVVLSADLPLLVTVDDAAGGPAPVVDASGRALVLPTPEQDPARVRRAAAERGARLRLAGVTTDLAPDLSAALASAPARAADWARAFADGLRDSGVTPVFTHVPAEGGPQVSAALRASPEAGVMASAGAAPGSGGTPGTPEAAEPAATGDAFSRLRGGGPDAAPYDGPVLAPLPAGQPAGRDGVRAAVNSLRGGADAVVVGPDAPIADVLDAVEREVSGGALPRERLETSLQRVLELRSHSGCRR